MKVAPVLPGQPSLLQKTLSFRGDDDRYAGDLQGARLIFPEVELILKAGASAAADPEVNSLAFPNQFSKTSSCFWIDRNHYQKNSPPAESLLGFCQ